MPRRRVTFDTVCKLGLKLPGVEEGTMYGTPALKVGGKLLACIPSHKSAEPGSLAVRLDFEQRDALLADAPEAYYVKPHYVDYPCVLVRLARITPDALQDLLTASWRFVSDHGAKRRRPRPSRR